MKAGLTLTQLAQELDRQNNAKRDFLLDTRDLTVLPTDEGMIEAHLPNGTGEFNVMGVAHRQLGDYCGIPAKFYDMLRYGKPDGKPALPMQPKLLGTNLNTLLRERPTKRMVRCFDFGEGEGIVEDGRASGRVMRALLSDRYLRRDNFEVAEAALKVLGEIPDVKIPTAQITEKHMYISALAPRVEAEVKEGDVVQAGVRITNSEVGWGALKIEPIVLRLVCMNGMTVAKATRVFHLGSQIDSDETIKVLSDESLRKDDEAFFAKLADVMRAAVDETQFNLIVAQMREAAQAPKMQKPKEAMEELGKKFNASEAEGESLLAHLIEGGDLTAYGALNAFTRAAQDVESYDRSMELEAAGGKILEMAGTKEWERIALAGA
ncbi:MAG TPA: DUF932 domain-containing protein [Longimicrobiales bacterium]